MLHIGALEQEQRRLLEEKAELESLCKYMETELKRRGGEGEEGQLLRSERQD
jgi:hypothetical protein